MEGGSRSGVAGGKLRLKHKRDGLAPALAVRPGALASNSSWFEREGLSDAENTWITLLRAVDPHLNHSSLGKVINLPEFRTKSSQIANPPPKPETFHAGMKQFQWVPFPLYCREDTRANDSVSHQNPENETVSLMEGENGEDERPGVTSLVPKHAPLRTSEYTMEESRVRHGIKQSTALEEREKIDVWKHAHQQSSPGRSPSTTQRYSAHWKGTTIQSEVESRRAKEISENNMLVQHRTLFNEAGSRLPAQESLSAIDGQEKTEDHVLTLDQCPMCQIRFTGKLSVLDLDSHLAKCLSESTEDVIW